MSIPYTPHPYQKKAIKFCIEQNCAGLFLDPGLGKTSTMYAVFKVLRSQKLVKRMLVIAPLRPALSVWPNESAKWTDFTDLSVAVLHGEGKAQWGKADVEVINPEGLTWAFEKAAQQKEWPWEMLVVDESTRFKHADTKRFKTLKPRLQKFRRRYILTGTPAPNGLLDLFGQVYILDRGNALGAYITHFRSSFFDATGYGGYTWKIRAGAEAQIYERLKPLVLRMSAEDYLELPPLIFNDVFVELPPDARKLYDTVEDDMIAEFNGQTIMAVNAAAATQKCRQIANGGAYTHQEFGSDGDKWTEIHNAKTEAVQDLVEELGGKPVLIAYEFKHDRERLQKAFPGAPYLGGGVSPKQQREVELAWNAGCLPVLLAQPQSVAHGLNLQGVGAAVIIHSMFWNLEDYDQLIRRVWRQGQKFAVGVHHIIARRTVDEAIMKGLGKKDRTQRALLDALKDYIQK